MKLTILSWVGRALLKPTGIIIEILFRSLLFLTPLGVFLTLAQLRKKASKISSLSAWTLDKSTWQDIYPGYILVTVRPDDLENFIEIKKEIFQQWIGRNKYLLAFLFMSLIVLLMIIKN